MKKITTLFIFILFISSCSSSKQFTYQHNMPAGLRARWKTPFVTAKTLYGLRKSNDVGERIDLSLRPKKAYGNLTLVVIPAGSQVAIECIQKEDTISIDLDPNVYTGSETKYYLLGHIGDKYSFRYTLIAEGARILYATVFVPEYIYKKYLQSSSEIRSAIDNHKVVPGMDEDLAVMSLDFPSKIKKDSKEGLNVFYYRQIKYYFDGNGRYVKGPIGSSKSRFKY